MKDFRTSIKNLREDIKKEIFNILDSRPNKTIEYGYGCNFLEVSTEYDSYHIDIKRAFINEDGVVMVENDDDRYEGELFSLDDVVTVDNLIELYELLVDAPEDEEEEEDNE